MKLKNLFLVAATTLVLVGCSDKSTEDNNQANKSEVVTSKSSKIEIVSNDNSNEIKVEQKDHKSDAKNGNSYYFSYGINSNYDLNSQPANKDASVRMKPRTVLDANMHIRSPYERVKISLIVQQLSTNYRLKCSACHDDYANGVIGPSLLGKDAKFIYKAINDFKTGVKSNPLMDDLIKRMSDKEIQNIANEIYKFNKEIEKLGAREI